jgi:hypothetical protein
MPPSRDTILAAVIRMVFATAKRKDHEPLNMQGR